MEFEEWWIKERYTWHLDDKQEGLAYLAAEIGWNAAYNQAIDDANEVLFLADENDYVIGTIERLKK